MLIDVRSGECFTRPFRGRRHCGAMGSKMQQVQVAAEYDEAPRQVFPFESVAVLVKVGGGAVLTY